MITDECENCQRLGSPYCKTCRLTQGVLQTHGSNYVQKHPVPKGRLKHSPPPGTDIGTKDRARRS